MSPHLPIHLPPEFEVWLTRLLRERGVQLEEPRALAEQVRQLSTHFIQHPGEPTPWHEPFAANAYLAYFLPLNTARLLAVWQEVLRFIPDSEWSELWDIGSGLSPTHWVLESLPNIKARQFWAVEHSMDAQKLYAECLGVAERSAQVQWRPKFVREVKPEARALGVFSYSFLEMQNQLPDLSKFDHLLIVEPSTRDCGRDLMQWRDKFIAMGFSPLAPCVHQQGCPLLLESKKDWCHTRVHFSGPTWWRDLEEHLPMQNRTLTYSYLLLSKSELVRRQPYVARVIGDTLREKGKSRQMLCRGPQREFLSWLHKQGEPPEIPHGALIQDLGPFETKAAELRVTGPGLTWIGMAKS